MSKLPQLNLRIPEQFHGLVRDIAQRLRERDGADFGANLTYWLHDQPALVGAVDPELAGRVARLEARLAVLEVLVLDTPAPPAPAVIPARTNAPYPDELLAQADTLKRQVMPWEAVWKTLGEPGTVNGLRNAVGKWRKRQDA